MEEDLISTYSHEEHQVIKEIWDILGRSLCGQAEGYDFFPQGQNHAGRFVAYEFEGTNMET